MSLTNTAQRVHRCLAQRIVLGNAFDFDDIHHCLLFLFGHIKYFPFMIIIIPRNTPSPCRRFWI